MEQVKKHGWIVIVGFAALALSGYAATILGGGNWYYPLMYTVILALLGGGRKLNSFLGAAITVGAFGLSAFLLAQNIPNLDWSYPMLAGFIVCIFVPMGEPTVE